MNPDAPGNKKMAVYNKVTAECIIKSVDRIAHQTSKISDSNKNTYILLRA